MITGRQCRAARALLNWSQADLGEKCGLSKTAINNFEANNASIKQSSATAIKKTFAKNNIVLTDDEGVKIRKDHVRILRGDTIFDVLWDDIIETLSPKGGEVLILSINEENPDTELGRKIKKHIERLKSHNIKERMIIQKPDHELIAPKDWYRCIPDNVFTYGLITFIYEDKVAFLLWGNAMILLLESGEAAGFERQRFEELWNISKPL